MSNENRNVPELRFPGFEDEWKNNELGKLLSITSGHSPSYYSEGSEYPLYKVNDLNNNSKFQNYSDLYVEKKHTPLNKKVIIFPKRGAAILLNKIRIINTPGYIDTNLMGLEFNDVNDTEFYYYAILREGLYRIADTSTIPQINNKHILPYKIYSPSYIEKNKLGNFFSKLDRQIELEEEKLGLLEQQKRGYMQKIFSQQLRFKDEKGNDYPKWIFKKFEEIFKVVPSKKYQIKSSEIENNASIPVIDQGQNLILGFSNNKEKVFNDFKNVIIYGDHTTVIKRSDKPFIIGGDGVKLLTSKVDIDISYLYNALQYFNVKSEGYKRHFSILKNKNFYISTSIEEQKRIANIFNKLDKYIEKQFAKVELLKQRKQGLLQKMFV